MAESDTATAEEYEAHDAAELEEPDGPSEDELDVMLEDRVAALEALLAEPERALTLAEKIAAAMLDAGIVTKSSQAGTGGGESFKYASAEAIFAAVRGPLLRRGVLMLPRPTKFTEQEITSSRGTKGTRVLIELEFEFTDGRDSIARAWRGEGQDYGDKAYGKAYTNAAKTFVRTAWLLPTEHDDPEATPAGERSAAGGAWATPASGPELDRLLDVLTRLVGGHRPTAEEYLAAVTTSAAGHAPAAFAGALSALPQWREVGVSRRAAEQEAGEQDARAEAPDTPATGEEEPAPDETPTEDYGEPPPAEPGEEWRGTPADRTAAGSVEPPPSLADLPPYEQITRLRDLGCTCRLPVAMGGAEAELDDACPIAGHGIAF